MFIKIINYIIIFEDEQHLVKQLSFNDDTLWIEENLFQKSV